MIHHAFQRQFCLTFFSLALSLPAAAQCPAIEFASARTVVTTDYSSSPATVLGALKFRPGFYLGGRYPAFGSDELIEAIPHFERHLINCFQKKSFGDKTSKAKDYSAGAGSQLALSASLNNKDKTGVIWLGYGQKSVKICVGDTPGIEQSDPTYPVPGTAAGGLFRDVNSDGFMDLIVVYDGAFMTQGGVSAFLGNGDGTFKPPLDSAAGLDPGSAAAGDFNGDGKLDLAVTNYSGSNVSILLGKGDGSFKAPVNIELGQVPLGVAVADVNGDGKLDLAVLYSSAHDSSSGVAVLLGNGDGTFKSALVFPGQPYSEYLAFGDFNVDGKADLAVADTHFNTVSVYLGKGDGTFGSGTRYLGATHPTALVIDDLNADGNPDIMVASGDTRLLMAAPGSNGITALLGNGDGTFQSAPIYPAGNSPAAIGSADFNGDGTPDIVVADHSSNDVWVYLNDGTGKFSAPLITDVRVGNPAGPVSVAAGDFNSDGKMDVAVADVFGGGVTVALGRGDGTFSAPVHYGTGTAANAVVSADFNGDGKLDLAVANGPQLSDATPSSISILLGNGDGSFQAPVDTAVTGSAQHLAVGDFNGDGKTDLAQVNYGSSLSTADFGGVSILLGKGDGTFRPPVSYSAGRNPNYAAVGDINGDGKQDLVVATAGPNSAYQLAILLGNGDGTFRAASLIPTDYGPAGVAIADFSGDGKLDLIVPHCCGDTDLTFLVGNGDGTFQPEVHFNGGPSPVAIAVADFNGDQRPDLAIADQSTPGAVSVLLNAKLGPGLANVSAATFEQEPLAVESIVSAFGSRLATTTAPATTLPLPTHLGGTTVTIEDSASHQQTAPLFFVSPGQVNYEIPSGLQPGTAKVTVKAGDGVQSTDTMEIVDFAPALFSVNEVHLAAAYVQRVRSGKAQPNEPIVKLDSGNNLAPAPIDLGPSTDQVYLVLFGTGLRNGGGKPNVRVGETLPSVLYTGPQGTFAGLDQINVLLPRTLAEKGKVPVIFEVNDVFSNTVYVVMK